MARDCRSFLGLFFAAALLPGQIAAQAPAQSGGATGAASKLGTVQSEIDRKRDEAARLKNQAQALKTDLRNLRQRLVSAAEIVQDRELRVITLEAKIADLVRQEKQKLARLNANRTQLAGVLVALQKMVQFPPEALLAMPGSPDDLVRSAILLRAVVPEIERRAAAIRFDLQALAATREATAKQRVNLASATQDLHRQRTEIRKLMAGKSQLLSQTLAEERRAAENVARLAAKARDLKGLMARLEEQRRLEQAAIARQKAEELAQRRADESAERAVAAADRARAEIKQQQGQQLAAIVSPPASFKSRRGRLPLPVVGDLVGRYGETLSTGLTRKGVDIAARRGSQVIATFDGKIAFAGKFRGYGQLLIIDHGDGYHTLLAGMAHIDAAVGQQVATGEPVGQMATDANGDADERPVLYVELRRKGQPINPLPWLAARKDKVSG